MVAAMIADFHHQMRSLLVSQRVNVRYPLGEALMDHRKVALSADG
jgi:hypothetical protein